MSRTMKDMPDGLMREKAREAGYCSPPVTRRFRTVWDRVMIAVEMGNDALAADWASWMRDRGYDVTTVDVDLDDRQADDDAYDLRRSRRTVFDWRTMDVMEDLRYDEQPARLALDPSRRLPADADRAVVIIGSRAAGESELVSEHVDVNGWLAREHGHDARMPEGRGREAGETPWTPRSATKTILRGIVKEANAHRLEDDDADVIEKDPGRHHWWYSD